MVCARSIKLAYHLAIFHTEATPYYILKESGTTIPESADVRNAIARGTLLFEQRARAIWFKLGTKECTICGPLNVRQNWSHGAPGVMPLIDRVSSSSGDNIPSTCLKGIMSAWLAGTHTFRNGSRLRRFLSLANEPAGRSPPSSQNRRSAVGRLARPEGRMRYGNFVFGVPQGLYTWCVRRRGDRVKNDLGDQMRNVS